MKHTFAGVQILRFAAAMLVAAMHITQAISIHISGRGETHYWGAGSAGVDIFFVISGFVMAISTAGQPTQWPARLGVGWVFMKRRIVRIVPLYWFYTLLKVGLLVAVPALAVKSVISPGHVAASLFFLPAVAPWGLIQPVLPVGWTLNFEMLFYLVIAAAVVLNAPRIPFCLIVFLALSLAGQLVPGSAPLAFYTQSVIFEFIFGMCIAHALPRGGPRPVGAGAAMLAAAVLYMFGLNWDPSSDRLLAWGMGAAAIVMGTICLEPLIDGRGWARPLALLGDASYSIYLSHAFVVPSCVMALRRAGITDVAAVFLLASAAVTAVGAASYLWLEKPLVALFKRMLFPPARAILRHAANPASE
jgi:peptidoglycan/LPS O-acetylase OafA/YrhL